MCVCVCAFAWVCAHLALSLSGSVRVWGGAERFRRTADNYGPCTDHFTVYERGEVAFLPVLFCKVKCCRDIQLLQSKKSQQI